MRQRYCCFKISNKKAIFVKSQRCDVYSYDTMQILLKEPGDSKRFDIAYLPDNTLNF